MSIMVSKRWVDSSDHIGAIKTQLSQIFSKLSAISYQVETLESIVAMSEHYDRIKNGLISKEGV